ncbi:MAG: hypothetical protein ABI155_10870 [Paralcaligenes sp.]
MKIKQIVTAVFCAMITSASVSALAADNPVQPDGPSTTMQENGSAAKMQGGMMDSSMMGGGATGRSMMSGGMMGGRIMGHSKMRHGMMGSRMLMPQLPAGNEKLQLQMQAEIMQKVGEIIGKYADKIVINKGEAQ